MEISATKLTHKLDIGQFQVGLVTRNPEHDDGDTPQEERDFKTGDPVICFHKNPLLKIIINLRNRKTCAVPKGARNETPLPVLFVEPCALPVQIPYPLLRRSL